MFLRPFFFVIVFACSSFAGGSFGPTYAAPYPTTPPINVDSVAQTVVKPWVQDTLVSSDTSKCQGCGNANQMIGIKTNGGGSGTWGRYPFNGSNSDTVPSKAYVDLHFGINLDSTGTGKIVRQNSPTITGTLTAGITNLFGRLSSIIPSGTNILTVKSASSGAAFLRLDRSDRTQQGALVYSTNGIDNWEIGTDIGSGTDSNINFRNLNLSMYAMSFHRLTNNVSVGTDADLSYPLGVSGALGVTGWAFVGASADSVATKKYARSQDSISNANLTNYSIKGRFASMHLSGSDTVHANILDSGSLSSIGNISSVGNMTAAGDVNGNNVMASTSIGTANGKVLGDNTGHLFVHSIKNIGSDTTVGDDTVGGNVKVAGNINSVGSVNTAGGVSVNGGQVLLESNGNIIGAGTVDFAAHNFTVDGSGNVVAGIVRSNSIHSQGNDTTIGNDTIGGNVTTGLSLNVGTTLNVGGNLFSVGGGGNTTVLGSLSAAALAFGVDNLGNATAVSFNGPLVGNASTATILQTTRTINGVGFNGSANIIIPGSAGDSAYVKAIYYDSITGGGSAIIAKSINAAGGNFNVTAGTGDIATNGNITAVSGKINNITVTAPITAATLTITGGKTLSVTNNASVSGTNTGDQIIVQSAADSLFNGTYFNSGSYTNNNMVFGCTPGGGGGCELTQSQFDGDMGADTVASLGSVRTVVGSYLPKVNFKDSANTRVSFPTGAVQGVGQGNSPTFVSVTANGNITTPRADGDTVIVANQLKLLYPTRGVLYTNGANGIVTQIDTIGIGKLVAKSYVDALHLGSVQNNADSLFSGDYFSLSGGIPNSDLIAGFVPGGGGGPQLTTYAVSGSGNVALTTSPVFTTPNIGSATGSVSGNAGSATTLATGRTISITGDIAYTSPSFTGSGNVTAAGTLATVASGATTGSSTAIPVVTFNNKGLVTAVTTAAVIAPAGTLTGSTLASGVTASSLTSVGTLTSLNVGGPVTLSKSGDAIYMAKSTSSGNAFYEMDRSDNTKQDALIGYTNGNINWELGFGISDAGSDTDFTIRNLIAGNYPLNIKASNSHVSIGTTGLDLGYKLGVSGTFGVSGTTTLASSLNGCLTASSGVVSSTGSACGGGGGSADSNFISMTLGTLNMTNTVRGAIKWRNGDSLYWDSANSFAGGSGANIWSKTLISSGAIVAGGGNNALFPDGSVAFAGGVYTISSDGTEIITPASGLTMFTQTGGAEAGRQMIGGGSDSSNGAYSYWAGDDRGGTGLGGGSGTVLPITGGGFPKWKLQDKNYGTVIQYNGSAAHDLTITSDAIQFNGLSTSNLLITPNNVEAQVFFQADANVDMESGVKADILAGAGKSGWCADASGNLYRGTLITVATIANILQCN